MLLIILVLLFLVDASSSFPVTLNYNLSSCYDNSTYGPNSPYVITNMNELLSTLVSQISTSKIGFVTLEKASQNDNQAIVYGLALCRGDMNPQDCHGCVDLASEQVMNECPRAVNAILWKEQCMIRYSNKSFFSLLQTHPMQISNNLENGTEDMFAWNLFKSKLDEVAYKAATDVESGKKYAIDASFFAPMNKHLYTMAQCSPDLTMDNCSKCFVQAKSASLDHLTGHGSKGCVVLMPSCSIRHEFYPFFQNEGKKRNNTAAKLVPAIIVPLAILGMLIAIGTFLFKRKNANKYTPFDGGNDLASAESLIMYELKVLEVTTNGFSDDQKLGQGGFGSVYKGTLSNGQEIAVKRLSKISGQGDEEFKNEVVLIANLQHRNLVKLLGFCLAREEKLLVYEFVTNKSLNYFLFGVPKEIELNWATRYNIIRGVARGLLYLHEDSRPRIIHRDLKSGNILLDANMNPKISDFGLARIFEVDQAEDNTNRVVGTYGYMAPEYAMHGQFSVKSDVYSFGVLILEIISGKKINARFNSSENGDLLTHAWRSLTEQNPLEFMDSTLIDTYSSEEVMLCIHLGLLCAQENTNERPTMSSTVLLLNNETTTRNTLPMPQRPQTFIYSSNETSLVSRLSPHSTTTTSSNSNNAMQLSKNQVTISEIHAR